jgi:DnaK suppressor protein
MTRQSALLRLHRNLLACRAGMGKKLAGDLANLRDIRAANSTGDSADLAFQADGDEMSSRLAELDDRGLSQIDRALARWQRGIFGICESCAKAVPLARLNALPYAAFCIRCVREMESRPTALARQDTDHWDQIYDTQAIMQDHKVDLVEIEKQISREL